MTVEADISYSESVFEQSIQHSIWSMFHGHFVSLKKYMCQIASNRLINSNSWNKKLVLHPPQFFFLVKKPFPKFCIITFLEQTQFNKRIGSAMIFYSFHNLSTLVCIVYCILDGDISILYKLLQSLQSDEVSAFFQETIEKKKRFPPSLSLDFHQCFNLLRRRALYITVKSNSK